MVQSMNANELLAGLAVDLEWVLRMSGAVHDLLLGGDQTSGVGLDVSDGDYLVGSQLIKNFMRHCALSTDEFPTVTTVASSHRFVALQIITRNILRLFDFFQCVSDVKQVVDMECTLQASDTTWWEGRWSTTLRTRDS